MSDPNAELDAYIDPADRMESPHQKPKRRLPTRLVAFLVIAGVIAIALIVTNSHLKANQTLYVINELDVPAEVQVDGLAAFTLGAHAEREIGLAEGRHQAKITPEGAPEETVGFTIENSILQRFDFNTKSVFILNVSGAAVFAWEEITYAAKQPVEQEPTTQVLFGDKFIALHTMHYVFEEPDETITIEGTSETRKALYQLTGPPHEIEGLLQDLGQSRRIKEYRELQARLYPGRSKASEPEKDKE